MRSNYRFHSRLRILGWLLPATLGLLACVTGPVLCATIVGRVAVQEPERPRKPARYHLGHLRSGRLTEPRPGAGPRSVVIFVEDASDSMRVSPTPPVPVMMQENEEFVPHVLPVRVGTAVAFPNADDFYHNVFSVMAGDRFDLGRFGKGESAGQTFTRPGVVVVRCEIHSRMKAYVRVLETACFTVPDSTGWFQIADVPGGLHTVKAWHPAKGEQARSVTVAESDTLHIRFDF